MARARKLFLTLASGSLLYSGMAPAIGLGEISLNSALNQPLDAEIELLEVGDLTPDELRVKLASVDVFNRAGVDRLQFLDDLRFTPLLRGGNSVIRVVSSKPVREPYLNFVVELSRPNGQLLREYTLLIDPPGSAATTVQAAPLPRAELARPAAMQLPPAQALPPTTQGRRYAVVRGDSLWSIARRLQADTQLSLPALMAAIHALNPQAFVAGDIDRLKAGASLLLPDQSETPAPQALAAPAAVPEEAAPPAVLPTAQPAPAAPEQIEAMQAQLDEVLASSERERLQLEQQMSDLQVQLTQLQLQMEEKSQQVQLLQAELQARAEQSTATAPATSEPAPALREPFEPVQLPATVTQPAAQAPVDGPAGSRWLSGVLAAGLLVGLAGGLFAWRRRMLARAAATATVPTPEPLLRQPAVSPVRVVAAAAAPVMTTPLPQTASQPRPVAAERIQQNEPDALEAAAIYLAYGRQGEARDLLVRALQKDPQRSDLRLRLLEVLAEMGDAGGFAQQELVWLAEGGDSAALSRLRAAHPQLHNPPAVDPLQNAVLELDEPKLPEASNELIGDTPLNLDDLSLDADWGLVSPFETPAAQRPAKAVAEEPLFSSNLQVLPEVFELSDAGAAQDEQLEDAFLDAFSPSLPAAGQDLDQLAGHPAHLSQLNMALAYIDQGNLEGACSILNQVISEGDDQQRREALEILARIA